MNVWRRSADRETKDKRNRDEAEHYSFIRNTDLFLRVLPFPFSFTSSFFLSSSSFSTFCSFSSRLPFLKRKQLGLMRPLCCVHTCILPSERTNPLSDFHEIWYERYAAGRHRSALLYNFLQSTGTHIREVGSKLATPTEVL